MPQTSVGELPLLLIGSFRAVIDDVHEHLSARGYADVRPLHGFALKAVDANGVSISEFARRLGVTKQAGAKTAASLEKVGLVHRAPDPEDARATILTRTARADEMLREDERFLATKMSALRRDLGPDRFDDMLGVLRELGGSEPAAGILGWLGRSTRA